METQDERPRHSLGALILLVIDLLFAVCIFLFLGFVVPVFVDMFRDFGSRFPAPTQIVSKISSALMAFHGVGLLLLTAFVIFLIIRMYIVLHRRGNRVALFNGLWILLFFFVVLIGIMIAAMFLPIFNAGGEVGGGPITESNQPSDRTR